ncbi:MAG: septum formation initiator family protein [Candidatus Paceibacterota bacterium]
MRNFQQKSSWRKIAESKPVLIVLGVLILFFAWSVFGFWNKMKETSKNKEMTEDKISALKQQKEKLVLDIESLNTDEGKEKFFRENFGLVKEGEDVIVVVEDKNQSLSPASNSGGFFSFFMNWFK